MADGKLRKRAVLQLLNNLRRDGRDGVTMGPGATTSPEIWKKIIATEYFHLFSAIILYSVFYYLIKCLKINFKLSSHFIHNPYLLGKTKQILLFQTLDSDFRSLLPQFNIL